MKIFFSFFCGLLLSTAAQLSNAGEVSVAVAANFTGVMQKLAPEFTAATGHKLSVSYGASGKFYAQIRNGAPFEVLLSADQSTPETLEKDHLAVPGSRFTYAVGALALWSAKTDLIDAEATVLKNGRFNKLALANPKLAPYGAAAVEVLQRLELLESTQAKWVQGENIAQTFQFVSSGNADIGFVALAQIWQDGRIREGSAWRVPANLHAPIRQDAVLLRRGETSQAARDLLAFLRGAKARAIIESYGYQVEGS